MQMIARISLAASLVLMAATFTATGASAATAAQSPLTGVIAADGSLVQKTQWGYGYCRGWARECAARWGWRTPQFFRCMGRHGC
jgi:hypothetical protein